jgi:hypothetical protein
MLIAPRHEAARARLAEVSIIDSTTAIAPEKSKSGKPA